MSKASELFGSSKNQNWRTGKRELGLLKPFGPIMLDPMTDSDNPTGAQYFFTPAMDVRKCETPWYEAGGLIFINPMYGRALGWEAPMIAEQGRMLDDAPATINNSELICLAPHVLDTRWCRTLQASAEATWIPPWRPVFDEQKPDGSWGPQTDAKGRLTGIMKTMALYYWGYRSWFFKEKLQPYGGIFVKEDR